MVLKNPSKKLFLRESRNIWHIFRAGHGFLRRNFEDERIFACALQWAKISAGVTLSVADWITTEEAARLTGYTLYHLRYLIKIGKVKAKKWGREWQVDRTSLLAYRQAAEKLGEKRGPKKNN